MAPPPVTIYVTSLTSQPKVRQHTDLLHRSLKALEIPYEAFDLVMDQDAKTRWQRAKPPGQIIGLPGYLVGGEYIGTMDDFEEAVETQSLPQFLKQDATASTSNTAPTVGEAELERLMREMSESDLDALAEELGVGEVGKVGLIVPQSEDEVTSTSTDPTAKPATASASAPASESESGIALGGTDVRDQEVGEPAKVGTGETITNPDLELEKKFAEVEIGGKLPKDETGIGSAEVGLKDIAAAGLHKLEHAVVGDKDTKEKVVDGAVKEKLD